MVNTYDPPSIDETRALLTIRVIWAALILGQVVFAAVIAVINSGDQPVGDDAELGQVLFYASAGLLALAVPTAYFIRGQIYKANWRGNAITPAGYISGNLLFLAMLEGASLLSLVAVLLGGAFWPNALPAALAVVVQLVNFPDGKPMRPALSEYERKPDGY
jgi:hypothetical protein